MTYRTVLSSVASLAIVLGAGLAYAQEGERSGGLLISPVVFERQAKPGETLELTLKVFNDSDEVDRSLTTSVVDFTADPAEGGQPRLVPEGENASSYSLREWISVAEGPYQLPPATREDITVEVAVPEDAEPGTHYAMVVVSEGSVPEEGPVAIQEQVGALVLVDVAGEVDTSRELASFTTDQRVYFAPPVTFTTRIRNAGSVHFKPFGVIEITNDVSGSEVAVLQVNEAFGTVLPDSARQFNNTWEPAGGLVPAMGKFSAVLTMSLGTTGLTEQVTISFWLLPLGFGLRVVLVLGALVVFLRLYGAWSVKRAGRRTTKR